jgi:hypothetical protein
VSSLKEKEGERKSVNTVEQLGKEVAVHFGVLGVAALACAYITTHVVSQFNTTTGQVPDVPHPSSSTARTAATTRLFISIQWIRCQENEPTLEGLHRLPRNFIYESLECLLYCAPSNTTSKGS